MRASDVSTAVREVSQPPGRREPSVFGCSIIPGARSLEDKKAVVPPEGCGYSRAGNLTWGVSSQAQSFRHCASSSAFWIRSVSPSVPCSPDDRITSHPVELMGSDHNPSCSRASGSGWRDHPFSRRVSARGSIRGHRPPGSGEAVAFSFAGVGLSHRVMPP